MIGISGKLSDFPWQRRQFFGRKTESERTRGGTQIFFGGRRSTCGGRIQGGDKLQERRDSFNIKSRKTHLMFVDGRGEGGEPGRSRKREGSHGLTVARNFMSGVFTFYISGPSARKGENLGGKEEPLHLLLKTGGVPSTWGRCRGGKKGRKKKKKLHK